ncbi:hypothetical protein KSP40_PGU014302 [Platanthera guangdongensis]|uniref:EF-hand domain-containing protein n=1 Tax=Platanthera guangdongensis TaxID=2320717 RepID=A0ABR2LMA6_9ASPA
MLRRILPRSLGGLSNPAAAPWRSPRPQPDQCKGTLIAPKSTNAHNDGSKTEERDRYTCQTSCCKNLCPCRIGDRELTIADWMFERRPKTISSFGKEAVISGKLCWLVPQGCYDKGLMCVMLFGVNGSLRPKLNSLGKPPPFFPSHDSLADLLIAQYSCGVLTRDALDWNGSKRGHVYKFLRSQGFVSSYDIAHQYTDNDSDAHKVVRWEYISSAANYMYLLLRETSLTEKNAFAFLKADSPGDYVTFAGFSQALCQLGLTGHSSGLSAEEMEDLWNHADIDGNGILDYGEFMEIWNMSCLEKNKEAMNEGGQSIHGESHGSQVFGFDVKNASLFPPEMEKGMWPEDYFLSDHAPLTVVFSPQISEERFFGIRGYLEEGVKTILSVGFKI